MPRCSCVKVYHLSPHANIQYLRGAHSPKQGAKGIYVSKSWASVVKDWAHTLLSKRFGGRGPSTLRKRLRRKGDTLERRGKLNANDLGSYQSLTVYKLSIPQDVFQECQRRMDRLVEQAFAAQGVGAIGAWGWGVETFILEEYLDQIRIVGRKTLSRRTLLQLYEQYHNTHQVQRYNIYRKMLGYQKEIDGLIQRFGPAPLLDRARRYAANLQDIDIRNTSRHYRLLDSLLAPYRKQL